MSDRDVTDDDLLQAIGSGEAVLFTGAGFSRGAHDTRGQPLPDSSEMAAELWAITFPDEEPDDSSLADLFEAALLRDRDAMVRYLSDRLTVGPEPLPAHLRAWFSAPWRRIYTLNVDDLETAAQRHFRLPRKLRTLSALDEVDPAPGPEDALDVVHLNGLVGRDVEAVTFSPFQYANRLCRRQREYERLAHDLERAPFVFVGTTLDEAILWQHVALERDGVKRVPIDSFLVTRSLSRARQVLLESFGIRWVAATAEQIADTVLRRLR